MKFIVMASDGVWDVTSGEDLFDTAKNNDNITANELAKLLVKNAVLNGSRDNVSCIVIKIN
jgi:serine/threonine protein phosphatase PrpC